MAHRDPRHRPEHRAALDMQIAGADGAQSHPDNGIPRIEDDGFGLFPKGEFLVFDVGQGFHGGYIPYIWNYYRKKQENKHPELVRFHAS